MLTRGTEKKGGIQFQGGEKPLKRRTSISVITGETNKYSGKQKGIVSARKKILKTQEKTSGPTGKEKRRRRKHRLSGGVQGRAIAEVGRETFQEKQNGLGGGGEGSRLVATTGAIRGWGRMGGEGGGGGVLGCLLKGKGQQRSKDFSVRGGRMLRGHD